MADKLVVLVDRKWKKPTYTIGRLYIDGKLFCNTLEDKDRGLDQTDSLQSIKMKKVYAETAIPTGIYGLTLAVTSPKYAAVKWYWDLCRGKMPRVLLVPGFEGILIHPGSTALDSAGCVLVGKNTKKGMLTESRATFKKLYGILEKAVKAGKEIVIEIK